MAGEGLIIRAGLLALLACLPVGRTQAVKGSMRFTGALRGGKIVADFRATALDRVMVLPCIRSGLKNNLLLPCVVLGPLKCSCSVVYTAFFAGLGPSLETKSQFFETAPSEFRPAIMRLAENSNRDVPLICKA